MYTGTKDIKFLTLAENRIMQHLVAAYQEFYELTMDDQQATMDFVDFGHYLAAAQNTLLTRGARRMDPENLIEHRAIRPTDLPIK